MRRRTKNIGKFLKKIAIEDFTTTGDGAGGLTQTWAVTHELWADIEPLAGRESIEAEALIGKRPYKFTFRYSSDVANINSESRIKYGTRYFNIHSAINLNEENEFMEVTAWEV